MNTNPSPVLSNDPFSESLLGEYARMLLAGTAGFSAIASTIRLGTDPLALLLVVGNLLVLGSLFYSHFSGVLRGLLLAAVAVAVAWGTARLGDSSRWWSPIVFFSPAVLVASLGLLASRELAIVLKRARRLPSLRSVAIAIGIGGMLAYMVAVPSIESVLERFGDQPQSSTIEELTLMQQLRIRSAKFAVFAIFTYVGACVASFLNVVAASAPRGESVAMRSSACPICDAPIGRLDNLPIYGYLNLGGRCRNCDVSIPLRYFLVEVVGATIFGSLFLYELITGAANVPGFQHYTYAGIVWIILYTKWPVVGIYIYHAALMSCLLMLALMEIDRLRCPKWLSWSLLVVFAAMPIAIATLQPVALDLPISSHLIDGRPGWMIRLLTSVVGGLVGWTLASLFRRLATQRFRRRIGGTSLPLAAALVGIALGWQATATIGLIFVIALLIGESIRRQARVRLRSYATALLLAVVMLHQPAWKWLASWW